MAKKKYSKSYNISPLHPSLHFILFLGLAFILVMIVAFVMQQTAAQSRAKLLCPNTPDNQVAFLEQLSSRCPQGVMLTNDNNGCSVWVCKTPTQGKPTSTPTP